MPKTFGEILREARKQQGLTAFDVSKAAGVNQSIYSRYENDQVKNVTIEYVKKFCKILHIDANQLFNLNDPNDLVIISEGVEYKQKLIEEFNICIKEIKETNYESLMTKLDELEFKIEEDTIEITYHNMNCVIGKTDSLRLIPLCCLVTTFISDISKLIEVEITTHEFDITLVHLYVHCENILNSIFSK